MLKAFYSKTSLYAFLTGAFLYLCAAQDVFAGSDVNDVAKNIGASVEKLPGLLTATAYLLALLFGVTGVLKIKDHVENPSQTPLRTPIIRLLIGGALVALPVIYEALLHAFDNSNTTFDHQAAMNSAMSNMSGHILTTANVINFNAILVTIVNSVKEIPGLITLFSYAMGLLLGVIGLIKIKDHVENPDRVEMKEGVTRLLIAGALLAMPIIYEAAFQTIDSSGITAPATFSLSLSSMISAAGLGTALNIGQYGDVIPTSLFNPIPRSCISTGPSLGNALCATLLNSNGLSLFLTTIGYLIGLVMVVWGVFKIKAHVLNPGQTGLHEGLTRLLTGGMFFALPALVSVAIATMTNTGLGALAQAPVTLYNDGGLIPGTCDGLDGIVTCMMGDVMAPLNGLINFFAFCAGIILIMVGISRLIKSAQEGARGPLGFGTFMTFAAGGALCSYNELMRAASATFFLSPITFTYATLQYTAGMSPAEIGHAHAVISAIIKFMIIVGLISFVRGIFIIREAAEGGQQASVMAGVTHMVGGALAVNLGPLINAVESTLGLTAYGINFA